MVQLSNLIIEEVVATQSVATFSSAEPMEADTISKNGRNMKSHTSRGNNKYFKFIAFLTLIVMLSGCSYRVIDYTMISSKNHGLPIDKSQGKKVEGKDVRFYIAGTIKGALDKALESAGPEYDVLVDGVVYSVKYWLFSGFKVTGIAVSSKKALAVLGEEGFQNWLAENNVFDPTTAIVEK